MLFGIDDYKHKIQIPRSPTRNNKQGEYAFTSIKLVTEEEMFEFFKKNYFRHQSMRIDGDTIAPEDPNYYFRGCYIIPRLYYHFPFLDCDSTEMYENAKFYLNGNKIPYLAYKSSEADKYWIICDKQMPFYNALNFIESYPHDHRYSWIARHKKEFAIRAVPKNNMVPASDDSNLEKDFTDDFVYWNMGFEKYWENNLIMDFLTMIDVAENI